MAKKESKAINKKDKKEKNSKDKTSFFKSFKAELKKVSWPTPKQLVNNTVAVIVIVLILSAIVFVLDLTFEAVNKYGVDRVKEAVVTSTEQNDSENNEKVDQSSEGSSENAEDTQSSGSTENSESTEQNQETPAE